MSLRRCALYAFPLVLVSCLEPDLSGELDLTPPAVLGLSCGALNASEPPAVGGLDTLTVRFSEPLDGWSVGPESLLVVQGRVLASCAASASCITGRCLDDQCQLTSADTAFRTDANSPPLSVSRQSLTHPMDVTLSPTGDEVVLSPRAPYAVGRLYTLLISAAVRDRSGNPLAAADGRWEGFAYDFVVGASPSGPPAASLVWPEADSLDVPPNLGELVVGFDAPVSGAIPAGLWLVGGGAKVAVRVQEGAGRCGEGLPSCLVLRPSETLQRSTRYELGWSAGLLGPDGEPVPQPAAPPGFTTGATVDEAPPEVSQVELAAVEGCIELSFVTDESAQAVVRLVGVSGPVFESPPGPWSTDHHWLLDPVTEWAEVFLALSDPFDNRAEHGPYALDTLAFPPTVVLTEVLANPAGAEPAQEFVELTNPGAEPVSLEGWRLRDDPAREGDVLPAVVIPPGAIALVVPSSFDVLSEADPAPDPAALLVTLDNATLGSGGLANSGEPVLLYDADDVLRSHFDGTAADGSLPENGQSVVRALGVGCAERGPWQLHPNGSASPGWLD